MLAKVLSTGVVPKKVVVQNLPKPAQHTKLEMPKQPRTPNKPTKPVDVNKGVSKSDGDIIVDALDGNHSKSRIASFVALVVCIAWYSIYKKEDKRVGKQDKGAGSKVEVR